MKHLYNNMLKALVVAVIIFYTSAANAQVTSPLTQFTRLPYLYNPAATGMENATDLKLGYKQQWGFTNGSPKSFVLGINHTINAQSAEQATSGKTKVGLGGYVVRQNVGDYNDLQTGISTAVHVPISQNYFLGLGLKAGFSRTALNTQDIQIRDEQDRFYKNLVMAGSLSYLNVDAGIMLHSDKFYIGYSPAGLIKNRLNNDLNTEEKLALRHTAMVGYIYRVNEEWEVSPNLLANFEADLDPAYYLNLKARFQSKFLAGIGFSPERAVSGILGFNPDNKINISYSFDKSINQGSAFNFGNSHEIILGIQLFSKSTQQARLW